MVDDVLKFRGKGFVSPVNELRQRIFVEVYSSPYITYPRGIKMYQDLRSL